MTTEEKQTCTIEELRALKKKAENDIREILRALHEKAGCLPAKVDLSIIRMENINGEQLSGISGIHITIEME